MFILNFSINIQIQLTYKYTYQLDIDQGTKLLLKYSEDYNLICYIYIFLKYQVKI